MLYKVSIIIPVYNNGKHIEECLNSIINQTIFKNIQVIIVNDGSTDSSEQILDKFRKYNNIQIIQKSNEGPGIARNIGIHAATGNYLMFIDGDDFLFSDDVIETLYETAISKNVDICGGNYVSLRKNLLSSVFNKQREKLFMNYEGYISTDIFQFPYGHQRFLFNRNYLLDNSIKYSVFLRGQDVTFLADALSYTSELYYLNKRIYVHRIGHKESKLSAKKAFDFFNSLSYVFKISERKNWEYMAENINIEMRIIGMKSIYTFSEIQGWELIDKANDEINKWNINHTKKLKPLLTQEQFSSKKKSFWNELLSIYIIYFLNKMDMIFPFVRRPLHL